MKKIERKNISSEKLPAGWVALATASAVSFVAFALLPFFIQAKGNFFSVGSRLLGWSAGKALESAPSVSIGWIAPSAITTVSTLGIVVSALFGIVVLWYARRFPSYRQLKRASALHIIVALFIAVLGALSYTTMRAHSQATALSIHDRQSYALTEQGKQRCEMVTIQGQESSVESANCQHAKSIPTRSFGYGIAPVSFVLEAMLFLIAPLLNWYRYAFSSRHVAGQKKDELFQ